MNLHQVDQARQFPGGWFRHRRRSPARVATPTVWPVVLEIYSTLLPPEARLEIADMKLFPYRLMLFVLLPIVVRDLFRRGVKLGLADALILLTATWMTLSMVMIYGIGKGFYSGGILTFDLLGAYFVGRVYLNSPAAWRRTLELVVPGIALCGIVMAIESISHVLFLRPAAARAFHTSITASGDAQASTELRLEVRQGLARAYGPFSHPILGGLQMSSFMALFLLVLRRSSRQVIGLASCMLGLFALSSAGAMAMALNLALAGFEKLRRKVRGLNWNLPIGAAAFLLLVVQFASKNGVLPVIYRYLTFDPATAFYRTIIWTYGSANVVQHPFFGLGFEEWARPDWMVSSSVDTHWLLVAMRFGLPAAVLLAAATLLAICGLGRQAARTPSREHRDVMVAVTISLFTLALTMFTVTLWGGAYAWFMVLLGGAITLAKAPVAKRLPRKRVAFAPGEMLAKRTMPPKPAHSQREEHRVS